MLATAPSVQRAILALRDQVAGDEDAEDRSWAEKLKSEPPQIVRGASELHEPIDSRELTPWQKHGFLYLAWVFNRLELFKKR